ncbi:GNAT family N-acetyltransferase [Clostridium manihotivorum]|uniref:GNAT family N-acetyltransferase n=1 Tax=Clostridium manihotivorum TaxID=2320868 RepID=A0A3R5UAU6_9CLOT|nr:GNAT family N-acetyltransferase [Clostridium manihotivorum]QAA33975.1 GNAT family N-acetyltransferase [Clostridium manihotivorum]
MESYRYINGGKEFLDSVEPLWELLNEYHKEKSIDFKSQYESLNFNERKKKLLTSRAINIDIVIDSFDNYIGYCISTISQDSIGEVDSLFLKSGARKYGIGDELIRRALEWLESDNVKKKVITVAAGNENVINFYNKYGFKKRRIVLELVEE